MQDEDFEMNVSGTFEENSIEPITAEKLKEETSIGGWLAFFLFAMMAGSIIGAVAMIAQFNSGAVGGNWLLALADPILGVLLFLLACYTLYSFIQRRPDAVFLAKTYVIAVFVSGILALFINVSIGEGTFDFKEIIRPLVWGVVWYLFLNMSTRVEEVIPTEYRHVDKTDWAIIGALIGIPLFCLFFGIAQVAYGSNSQARQDIEFLEEVVLLDGEYTDGRIVFKCPEGFACEKMEVEGMTFYTMKTDTQGITIVSEYNDVDTQNSADAYWKDSTEDGLKEFNFSTIQDEEQLINGNKAFIKTGKYESKLSLVDGRYVYRRFAVLFNKESGKACLVNCFDQGDDSYFELFLKTIRFE